MSDGLAAIKAEREYMSTFGLAKEFEYRFSGEESENQFISFKTAQRCITQKFCIWEHVKQKMNIYFTYPALFKRDLEGQLISEKNRKHNRFF